MNYKLKYRPKTWAEWVGQKSATEAQQLVHRAPFQVALTEFIGGGKSTLGCLMTKHLHCETEQERRPCASCPACLEVEAKWWRTGLGPIGMPGEGIFGSNWFRVFDCTTLLPTDVKAIRDEFSLYGRMPKVYVFDELHRAQVPTQELFLKLLEEDLPGSMIFCIAKDHIGRITKALLQRLYILDIGKPEPEELLALVKRVTEGERIEVVDAGAPECLIEECACVPRDILNGLEIVAIEGRGLSLQAVKRVAARIRLVGQAKEADL